MFEGSVYASRHPVEHGALVTGSDVTMCGLAAEHVLRDFVVWSGENGASYFKPVQAAARRQRLLRRRRLLRLPRRASLYFFG